MSYHPAALLIRSALIDNSFTSGTCKIPIEQCKLYYNPTPTSIASLNLATASDAELAQLVAACDAAPFGRGNETVLDDTYRKALKLELSQFALPFELAGTSLIHKIQHDLVKSASAPDRVVRAEPYKLNIYDKGAFFKAHRDTPRGESMFASLVIVFPTAHDGGALVLRENGNEFTFDASEMLVNSTPSAPEISYIAFYSDTEHEVLPVTSGMRVTLTYNLYFEDMSDVLAPSAIPNAKQLSLQEALMQLIDDQDFLPDGGHLCFGLTHQYSIQRRGNSTGYSVPELARYLKGSDALIYSACISLGLEIKVRVIYKGHDYTSEVHVADEPAEDMMEMAEDDYTRFEGMDCIPEEYSDDLVWVTPQSTLNRVESAYLAYGNEYSVDYMYGDVCLMVALSRGQDSD